MVHRLIHWAVHNKLVVTLLAVAVACVGSYALMNINIEAYPDPAPAIVEVIAQYPGASAEEVERQVTVPMEVALSGMPGLVTTRSKSLFGLGHVRNQFEYGIDPNRAKTEVLNRLATVTLPPSVVPQLNPASPIGEIYRYYLSSPRDADGRPIYSLSDMKSLQDWVLDREFRRIPRIGSVVSFGGEVKRYEVRPDPEKMRKYGISLEQLENALRNSNGNAGGDYLMLGETVQAVRGLGLIGGGQDPVGNVLTWNDSEKASDYLRGEEERRLRAIRQIVLASNNNIPIRVNEVVDGGRTELEDQLSDAGVVVGHQTRLGRVAAASRIVDEHGENKVDAQGKARWDTDEDVVQGVVLMRKGEESIPALHAIEKKVEELNGKAGQMLPGVKLVTFNDRTELINRTTETVKENVLVGLGLVTLILLVFLNDLRSALIVAINIPLSLLCSFMVLYLRGQSANLLSLGAVDFGIIADSSIIMVECIYSYLSKGQDQHLPMEKRIEKAAGAIERILLFSTLIMIFALLPLFTMKGPEGQIFGPMADTYAVALGSALVLSVTLSPMLCRVFFKNLKPRPDNRLVRWLNRVYLGQLEWALRWRWGVVIGFVALVGVTVYSLQFLGREFMPALEEGNVYVRGTFPVNISLEEVTKKAEVAREVMQQFPEIKGVLSQMGRPDDGTDPTGFYNAELFGPLLPQEEWPLVKDEQGWRKWFYAKRHRSKNELIGEMNAELKRLIPGVDWSFSQAIRDNVLETLSGVKGENSIKIIGSDLTELQKLAEKTKEILTQVPGIENVGIFSIRGQTNLEFFIDAEKCARWNVSTADVQDVVQTAVGGKALSKIVEGERSFDLTLRWPRRLRSSAAEILNIPVDVIRNDLKDSHQLSRVGNDDLAIAPLGSSRAQPALAGSAFVSSAAYLDLVPRRRLGDLVSPVDEDGLPDAGGSFVRSAASTIYREQGKRLIAVSFSVRNRDLASAVSDAQAKTAHLFQAPYEVEWGGEFQEMQEAGHRLMIVVSLALVLILVLLYLALQSLLDALVVLTNILVMCIGGVWALLLAGETFNISAGVGFISILGVGTMSALLFISRYNMLRAHEHPLDETLRLGTAALIRPQCMTALTAILGLLPAALSTKIGSETQRPLAIVVVGGMLTTLLLTNLIPVLYSFYGKRTPPEGAGELAH